jgi:type IV pilus assembly protein PilB
VSTENKLNEKNIRIALLFREATLLDEPHWKDFATNSGLSAEKSAVDILTQEVSLRAFRELFAMDVLKFKYVPKGNMAELEHVLTAPVRIYPTEIAAILKRNQPDVARLCHQLILRHLITTDALEKALEMAERNALNVYEVLVAEGLVTPDIIEKTVQERTSEFAMENRTLLAGEILAFNNLVTREDLERAMESRAVTKAPLARTFEQLKILTQDDVVSALRKGVELPMVELLAYDVSPELIEMFPGEFMRRQLFLPLSIQAGHYEIGTADPFNLALADTISLLSGRRVSMIYSPHSDLLTKFDVLFPDSGGSTAPTTMQPEPAPRRVARPARPAPTPASAQASSGSSDAAARVSDADASRHKPEPYVDNLSTVQLVTQIIESAVSARTTDIHIEPQADSVRIRYRVDGELHNIMKVPSEMLLSVISRIKVLASMNVTERRRPQDGHFSFSTRTGSYDFRISTMPSYYGEKIVMRVLDSSSILTGLGDLGLETAQQKTLEKLIARPYGLILVTGPTGSGKTSTLYACLSEVNRQGVNIITIEDPIEYQIDGITQVQVDTNIDLTFASGLRAALRQDPDIIMVGEIRDPDTAHTAIRAAMTGHLVFATLHTNTALGAVSALVHMDVKHYLLASALSGIVAQRLLRRICPACKKSVPAAKAVLRDLGLDESTKRRFFAGKGCEQCFGTGFRGRTGVFEVVALDEELRQVIASHGREHDMAEIVAKGGMGLFECAVKKVLDGVTTPAEVLEAVAMM